MRKEKEKAIKENFGSVVMPERLARELCSISGNRSRRCILIRVRDGKELNFSASTISTYKLHAPQNIA